VLQAKKLLARVLLKHARFIPEGSLSRWFYDEAACAASRLRGCADELRPQQRGIAHNCGKAEGACGAIFFATGSMVRTLR